MSMRKHVCVTHLRMARERMMFPRGTISGKSANHRQIFADAAALPDNTANVVRSTTAEHMHSAFLDNKDPPLLRQPIVLLAICLPYVMYHGTVDTTPIRKQSVTCERFSDAFTRFWDCSEKLQRSKIPPNLGRARSYLSAKTRNRKRVNDANETFPLRSGDFIQSFETSQKVAAFVQDVLGLTLSKKPTPNLRPRKILIFDSEMAFDLLFQK